MRTNDLNKWEDFRTELGKLQRELRERHAATPNIEAAPLLYRGQRDSTWPLQTTLERYKPSSLSLARYYTSIHAAKPQIEAHTQYKWDIKAPGLYAQEVCKASALRPAMSETNPAYEYLVYLRHHSFPSPLLDWTRSPYVAAFFAFREEGDLAERVAIFVYCDVTDIVKVVPVGPPAISVHGAYARTHRRHFLQQSQYTECTEFKDGQWFYTSHEEVFKAPSPTQDVIWKFTLPQSERHRVLTYLDQHNLNGYSLFGTEESLMEMMARRELPQTDPTH
jgi:hypothetical protein